MWIMFFFPSIFVCKCGLCTQCVNGFPSLDIIFHILEPTGAQALGWLHNVWHLFPSIVNMLTWYSRSVCCIYTLVDIRRKHPPACEYLFREIMMSFAAWWSDPQLFWLRSHLQSCGLQVVIKSLRDKSAVGLLTAYSRGEARVKVLLVEQFIL